MTQGPLKINVAPKGKPRQAQGKCIVAGFPAPVYGRGQRGRGHRGNATGGFRVPWRKSSTHAAPMNYLPVVNLRDLSIVILVRGDGAHGTVVRTTNPRACLRHLECEWTQGWSRS